MSGAADTWHKSSLYTKIAARAVLNQERQTEVSMRGGEGPPRNQLS